MDYGFNLCTRILTSLFVFAVVIPPSAGTKSKTTAPAGIFAEVIASSAIFAVVTESSKIATD